MSTTNAKRSNGLGKVTNVWKTYTWSEQYKLTTMWINYLKLCLVEQNQSCMQLLELFLIEHFKQAY